MKFQYLLPGEKDVLKQKWRGQGLSWKQCKERIFFLVDTMKAKAKELKAKGKTEEQIQQSINDMFMKQFEQDKLKNWKRK